MHVVNVYIVTFTMLLIGSVRLNHATATFLELISYTSAITMPAVIIGRLPVPIVWRPLLMYQVAAITQCNSLIMKVGALRKPNLQHQSYLHSS